MAKIKLGGLAQDVRGSQNGLTFARNKAGAYVRAKASPCNPQTARQLAQRAILSQVSQAWRAATAVQRANWIAWATSHPVTDVFGDSLVLAGNAAYCKINGDRLTLGLALSDDVLPDPETPPPAATGVAISAASGDVTVTLAGNWTAGDCYEFWTSPGQSAGVGGAVHKVRLAKALVTEGEPADTVVFDPTDLNPKLGFAEDQVVCVLVCRFSQDGILIDSTRFDVTVGE